MLSVIIIDQMHPSIIPGLELLGFKVDYRPKITRIQLLEVISDYQGLVVRSKTSIDKALIHQASNLRFVARAGAGVDNLDEATIRKRGIHIINAPEGNRDSLGEHMVGMLLSILHRINASHQALVAEQWDREAYRGTELGNKTVGIIGCGNMGIAFAKRLSSFDCTVLGYDKYLQKHSSTYYQPVTMEELYHRCDILSLHVPLTDETREFYNYSFFQQFEHPLVLLNSARGEILPLNDLVDSLREGKLTGVALDVFEYEPFLQQSFNQRDTYNYLIGNPSVVLSPHIAGWSHESYERINQVLIEKITEFKQAGSLD